MIKQKRLGVVFLQETHCSEDNEVELGLWLGGQCGLSHGSNLNAGVAVLFSPRLGSVI